MELLSPGRAELAASAAGVFGGSVFATLSVSPSETMVHLQRVGAYLAVFFLVREIGWRLPPWSVAVPLVVVAVLESLVGVTQHLGRGPGADVSGTYVNHNHYAGFLEMTLPFAVAYAVLIFRRASQGRGGEGVRTLLRPAAIAVAALIFLAILLSYSRMGLAATSGSLLVMVLLGFGPGASWRRNIPVIGALAVALVLVLLFLIPAGFLDRYALVAGVEGLETEGRVTLWAETLQLIRDYPVFGCGMGAYESAFLAYKQSMPLVTDNYAHNDYLQLWAEGGVLGFGLGVALILLFVGRAGHLARNASESRLRYLALASTGAFAAILLHSLTDFNLYIPANAMLLAWVAGLVSAVEIRSGPLIRATQFRP